MCSKILLSAFILLLIFIFSYSLHSQTAFSLGSTGADFGKDIAVDAMGNIYTAGYFQGIVDFDPSDNSTMKTSAGDASNPAAVDVYLAKYDQEGNFQWVIVIGSPGEDMPHSIEVDAAGNIYMAGYFSGLADFNPSDTSEYMLDAETGRNLFLAKYNIDGNFVWAIGAGDAEEAPFVADDQRFEEAFDLALDAAGNVYITGTFCGTIDLDPSDGYDGEDTFDSRVDLQSKPTQDIFVASYSESGKYRFGFAFGSDGQDQGHAICIDSEGNILLGGFFSQICNFNPDGQTLLQSSGLIDAFVAKYDNNGSIWWAKGIGSTGEDQIRPGGMANDTGKNVYICGDFYGKVDFNPDPIAKAEFTSNGSGDIFLAKFDTDGKYKWALAMGGTAQDAAHRVALDSKGDVYATGWFRGTVSFAPQQSGIDSLQANSSIEASDIFLAKYDNKGKYKWAYNFGGAETNADNYQLGSGLACDSHGNVLLTGRFSLTANLSTNGEYKLTSNGGSDAFIAKFDSTSKLWVAGETPGSLKVISPNGGEYISSPNTYQITWESNSVNKINIEYSLNKGKKWTLIVDSLDASAGACDWHLPESSSLECLVRISNTFDKSGYDISDRVFTIDWLQNISDDEKNRIFDSYSYPNPFELNTIIQYSVKKYSHITLKVLNYLDTDMKILYEGNSLPGEYSIIWDGTDQTGKKAPVGVYYYIIESDEGKEIGKMLLLH